MGEKWRGGEIGGDVLNQNKKLFVYIRSIGIFAGTCIFFIVCN